MHIISIIVFSGLTYTAARFGLSLIKELAEIANEAWQSADSE